ncbi:hypothetical protein GCM10023093_28880 [Nemorincola caseinilytica]|uniref:Uncharacterized protein n=1 Tax=Nemorincola caseinilytica TaxID=2054315 RepID=A0ABP8NR20_9BACT
MPHTKHLLLGAVAAIALLCCNKRYDPGVSAELPGPYTNVAPYDKVKPKAKAVTVNATAESSFYGNSGTRYVVPANAFMFSDSTPAVGSIQLQVAEMLTPTDMFFSGVMPISPEGPLISGGEVLIQATQNGRQLYLMPGKTMQIFLPQKSVPEPGMSVYLGTKSLTNESVMWTISTDTLNTITYATDTIRVTTDTIGFVNADKILTDTPSTSGGGGGVGGNALPGADSISIEIFPHDHRPVDSFRLYVYLSGTNSITPLPGTVGGKLRIRLQRRFATIVAVGFFNGYIYADNVTKAIKGDPTYRYDIHPYKMTAEELRAMLDKLQ